MSTFILTTPFVTAVLISSLVEPEPPWKTKKLQHNLIHALTNR